MQLPSISRGSTPAHDHACRSPVWPLTFIRRVPQFWSLGVTFAARRLICCCPPAATVRVAQAPESVDVKLLRYALLKLQRETEKWLGEVLEADLVTGIQAGGHRLVTLNDKASRGKRGRMLLYILLAKGLPRGTGDGKVPDPLTLVCDDHTATDATRFLGTIFDATNRLVLFSENTRTFLEFSSDDNSHNVRSMKQLKTMDQMRLFAEDETQSTDFESIRRNIGAKKSSFKSRSQIEELLLALVGSEQYLGLRKPV